MRGDEMRARDPDKPIYPVGRHPRPGRPRAGSPSSLVVDGITLTVRQQQLIRLLLQGVEAEQDQAQRLGIRASTVNSYWGDLFGKLHKKGIFRRSRKADVLEWYTSHV